MLRSSLGKAVHTVRRAGTNAAKVSLQELHKLAVRERAVMETEAYGTGNTVVPSNAHISTPFFQKIVFFSKICFWRYV